jgi:hypothetical protein
MATSKGGRRAQKKKEEIALVNIEGISLEVS